MDYCNQLSYILSPVCSARPHVVVTSRMSRWVTLSMNLSFSHNSMVSSSSPTSAALRSLSSKLPHDLCLLLRDIYPDINFFYQPSSVSGCTSAFLLAVHRLCDVIEGRLCFFLPHWLRTGWQSAISQGKIPWNTYLWPRIEPGLRRGQWDTFILSLSYRDWHGHTVIISSETDISKTSFPFFSLPGAGD